MKREESEEGMKIVFRGRDEQETTLGEIIKLNLTRAKVRAIKSRSGKDAGTVCNVHNQLMEAVSNHDELEDNRPKPNE